MCLCNQTFHYKLGYRAAALGEPRWHGSALFRLHWRDQWNAGYDSYNRKAGDLVYDEETQELEYP